MRLLEAFHYVHHPVTRRLHGLLDSGELGDLQRVEALFDMPAPAGDDPRWSLELAGGALMDVGCYCLHAARTFAPWAGGPPSVVSARGAERAGSPGVDEWMEAELAFPGGATVTASCSMTAPEFRMPLRVIGTRGEATAMNFARPDLDDRVVVRTAAGERVEELGRRSSYAYQLDAVARTCAAGQPFAADADDAVAQAELIDDVYRAAGFAPRPTAQEAPA